MLTTLEANFVTEYKISGNATQALKAAGYKFSSPTSARLKACRLLKKPEIIETLANHQTKLVKQLETPNITTIAPARVITLPTKEQYAEVAWKRSSDESTLKEDTKYKYYDLAGKVLGHVRNDSESRESGDTINIICKEMKLSLNRPEQALDLKTNCIEEKSNSSEPNITDIIGHQNQ